MAEHRFSVPPDPRRQQQPGEHRRERQRAIKHRALRERFECWVPFDSRLRGGLFEAIASQLLVAAPSAHAGRLASAFRGAAGFTPPALTWHPVTAALILSLNLAVDPSGGERHGGVRWIDRWQARHQH
jgi:hypothetical protein